MKNIAFCPIDLPFIDIDEDLLSNLIKIHNIGHHDKLWNTLPLLGRVKKQEDFLDATLFEKAWEQRYNKVGTVLYNQNVYDQLKSLFDHIEKLPLIATHAQILSQIADVGKHYDLKNDNGKPGTYIDDHPGLYDNYEPCSYKIILNCFDEPSFYVAEGFGKPNIFVKYPPDTNTFVINEKTYPHGAKKPSKTKFIVSIFGLLDTKHHNNLLQRSTKKYSSYMIKF